MFAMLIAGSLLAQAAVPPAVAPPVQFVMNTRALKAHAATAGNELTIRSGAGEPYLSSVAATDFLVQGEIRLDTAADAVLVLYAWEPEIAAGRRVGFPLRIGNSDRIGQLSGDGVHATQDRTVAASFLNAAGDWQAIQISCIGRHVRVSVPAGVLVEGDLPSPEYGRIALEVTKGSISLRNWRFLEVVGPATRPLLQDNPDVPDAIAKVPGVTTPELRQEVKPDYTPNAMRRKVRGTIELEAIVEPDGFVGPIRVTKSLDSELDIQAIRAVRQWAFTPAIVDGKPVRCRVSVVLSFILK